MTKQENSTTPTGEWSTPGRDEVDAFILKEFGFPGSSINLEEFFTRDTMHTMRNGIGLLLILKSIVVRVREEAL